MRTGYMPFSQAPHDPHCGHFPQTEEGRVFVLVTFVDVVLCTRCARRIKKLA